MTRAIVFTLLAAGALQPNGALLAARGALMPLPAKMTPGAGRLAIDTRFGIAGSGCPEPVIARFKARIARQTGIPLTGAGQGLAVTCRAPAPDWPALGEDESYTLDVGSGGARLTAPTTTGALRGFETFSQLIAPGPDGFEVPAIHIEDRPRFVWRGMMLDV